MAIPLNIPQEVQDRLNRTAARRKAERQARRQAQLAAMTPSQRQALQARIDRIEAVPAPKRSAFMQASRLAVTARTIKARVEGGMSMRDVLDSLDTNETAAVNWLTEQVMAIRSV